MPSTMHAASAFHSEPVVTFREAHRLRNHAALLMRYPRALGIARGVSGQQGFQLPEGPFILGELGTILVVFSRGALRGIVWRVHCCA